MDVSVVQAPDFHMEYGVSWCPPLAITVWPWTVTGPIWAVAKVAVKVDPVTAVTATCSRLAPVSIHSSRPTRIPAMEPGVTVCEPEEILADMVVWMFGSHTLAPPGVLST